MGLYTALQVGSNIYDGMTTQSAINCEINKYTHFNTAQKLQMKLALRCVQAKAAKNEYKKIKEMRGNNNNGK